MSFCIGKVLGYGQHEFVGTLKIELSLMEKDEKIIENIPLQHLYAGKQHGMMFFPEINDLVKVELDEKYRPIGISSGVFGSNSELIKRCNAQNDIKVIMTRSGNEVCFNDKDEMITIKTAKDNLIKLDNKNDEIKIEGKKAITIIADKNQVCLKKNQLELKASNDLTLTCGKSKLVLKKDGTIAIEGLQIKLKGTMKTEVETKLLNFSSIMTNFK